MSNAGQNPYGRGADVPSPKSNIPLTPRDLQKPPGMRQLMLGIMYCCHQVPWDSAGRGWLPIAPFPTKIKVVIVTDNASP